MNMLHPRPQVTTRITFGGDFLHAMRVRGLTLADVAKGAHVSPATVSSAARGRPVNMRTAIVISRLMANTPVVAELEQWSTGDDDRTHYSADEDE
jgi:transcriptional regulator with XRE-family HTH domain